MLSSALLSQIRHIVISIDNESRSDLSSFRETLSALTMSFNNDDGSTQVLLSLFEEIDFRDGRARETSKVFPYSIVYLKQNSSDVVDIRLLSFTTSSSSL